MLSRVYLLTKQDLDIPRERFAADVSDSFFQIWQERSDASSSYSNAAILDMLTQRSKMLSHRALRLAHFAPIYQFDESYFYLTHGDAGGNFRINGDRVPYCPGMKRRMHYLSEMHGSWSAETGRDSYSTTPWIGTVFPRICSQSAWRIIVITCSFSTSANCLTTMWRLEKIKSWKNILTVSWRNEYD